MSADEFNVGTLRAVAERGFIRVYTAPSAQKYYSGLVIGEAMAFAVKLAQLAKRTHGATAIPPELQPGNRPSWVAGEAYASSGDVLATVRKHIAQLLTRDDFKTRTDQLRALLASVEALKPDAPECVIHGEYEGAECALCLVGNRPGSEETGDPTDDAPAEDDDPLA